MSATPSRTGLRTTRRVLWHALAVVLVLMALGAVAASGLLPWLERNPERVEAWLGQRVGHPVAFDSLQSRWTRRGPLLQLGGLRIGQGADVVTIGAAEVLVAQYAGLLPGRSLTELRLRDLALVLARDADGRWHVRGLPGQDGGGDPFSALERLGELQVIGGSLTIHAPSLGIHATVPGIDVRMQVNGDRVRAAARAWMAPGDAPLVAVTRFDRDSGDGELYAGIDEGDLGAWSSLLRVAGVSMVAGHGQAEAWVGLRDSRVETLVARVALEDIGLRGRGTGDDAPGQAGFDHLAGEFQWSPVAGGWRLDVPRLEVADGGTTWRTERLAARSGARYALVADRIEAAPLLAALALSDRVSPAAGAWLGASGPHAVLEDVELAGVRGGAMRVRARVQAASFDPVDDRPGASGLRGALVGDERGLAFQADPQAPVRFDWPRGFGVVHEVALAGQVLLWHGDGGWQVQTPALRVQGDGYGAHLRGGLLFEPGGGRPRIEMAARLDEARVPVARRFWVRHLMPERAVAWLDAALVDGRVLDGRAVVSGDLDDWPFDDGAGPASGVFHAEATLADATLKFQPDWPAAERLQGEVRFVGDGFDFRGSGEVAGVPVRQLEAGIADFSHSELTVTTRTAADTGRVIALLQQSPLAVAPLRGLQAQGDMDGVFAMLLPLYGSGEGPRIEGVARLAGVRAAMPEWGFALQDLRGEVAYDQRGFSAPSLQATLDGRPGSLALRAGEGHVAAPEHVFEGGLRAELDAAALVGRAPALDWLLPHLEGRSDWTVDVAVPRGAGGRDARPSVLALHSDLVGTALALPAPLRKPAQARLPARISIPLPTGTGEVDVRLGQTVSLRARNGTDGPAVRVALGGGAAAAPDHGLVVEGHTAELAALEWAGLVAGGGAAATGADASSPRSGPGAADARLPLREVDLRVDRLLLAGGSFGSVHVATAATDDGTALQFDGAALAGRLTLPDARRATLAGHFDRLHWLRQDGPGPDPAAGPSAVAAEADGPDPSLLPPIRLSVGDLRLGQAQLGNATLVTTPVNGGMRIEQLETQSDVHHVVASGDWTGRGASARTGVDVRVASADFGRLLQGLGYQGYMRGGDGRLQMSATWPGSPAGFSAERLDGTLALALRDGQLVEVEPGAGRLLGLLSIAELPRRLSLDFRDFFERGFAFNRIEGDIAVVSGQARSDNLLMDGPAATIHIAGQADLRARTYDQTIDVLPKSGNVLTAVGAIAAGPVGAAVGAMANAVLRKPLSELGSTTYRVTGPWQEPRVEVVRREPPQMAEGETTP